MQAQPEIRAADDAWIILGLEPARAQVHAPRRQTGEPPLELRPPRAVSGDEDDDVRKPARWSRRLPSANPILEPQHGVDDDVEVFVLGPARRADEKPDQRAVDAETREQGLAVALAVGARHRREDRRRAIVEHGRVLQPEPALEKLREPARDR